MKRGVLLVLLLCMCCSLGFGFTLAEKKSETIVITTSHTGVDNPYGNPILPNNNQVWDDLELYFVKNETNVTHYTIMDRNMGATERYNQDPTNQNTGSYGFYYQWGNNRGFEACYTEGCTPDGSTTGKQLGSSTWSKLPNETIRRYGRKHFYIGESGKQKTWMANPTTGDNIWGGGGDTYTTTGEGTTLEYRMGPCPEGYHIPSVAEWVKIYKARSGSSALSSGSQFAKDFLMPFAGRRLQAEQGADANTMNFLVGGAAYAGYWTSSPSPTNAEYAPIFYFGLNDKPKYYDTGTSRTYGRSVRCVKNEFNEGILDIHSNGGKKAVIAIYATGDDAYVISSLGTPTKTVSGENVEFLGWYTTESFVEGTDVNKGDVVTNLTDLYARRGGDAESVIYTYYPGDGQLDGPSEIAYAIGETINPTTSVIPTRDLFVFKGWYDSGDNKIESHTVSNPMDLYARWAEDTNNNGVADEDESFTVVFSGAGEGGTLSGTLIWENILTGLTLGEAGVVIPEPIANSGYVFGGWEPKTPESGDVVSTGTVYTVTWKLDSDGDGIPDEDERTRNNGRSGGGRRPNNDEPENKPESNSNDDGEQSDNHPDTPSSEGDKYTQELKDAYTFAYENGITTQEPIDNANLDGSLTRIAMAKMLSKYAMNVLGLKPDTSRVNKFNDVSDALDAQYDDGVTLAYQLGIMGINMPNNEFRPYDLVPRSEFVTALSRMRYGTPDGIYEGTWEFYRNHMELLSKLGIVTVLDPSMIEVRGYVMLMLMRSAT